MVLAARIDAIACKCPRPPLLTGTLQGGASTEPEPRRHQASEYQGKENTFMFLNVWPLQRPRNAPC